VTVKFRPLIFWLHLVAGVVAGLVIGVMSFTGAALAFEKEIIAWAERDVRHVTEPGGEAKPLPLDELLTKARAAQPEVRHTSATVYADPGLAVMLNAGRTNSCYVNPYTGEVKSSEALPARRFLQAMNDWHRWLGREGDGRAVGKAITGACNLAFLVLALSGLYLWWPRQWTRAVLRAITWPSLRLRGKARDWNWHNAVGLWSAPVLIVLTATALPMSYRWAGDAVFRLTGSPVPTAGGPGGNAGPAVEVPAPAPGAKRLGYAALLAGAQQQVPKWEQITIRLGGGGPRGGGGENRGGEERRGPQPVSLTVREHGGWPPFASTQLSLDPFTGAILRAEGFADYNHGRQVRSWMRFLHTGEALGVVGQVVAALASLGGLVLVWTGFALAVRRLVAALSRRLAAPNPSGAMPVSER
jgi:uncharacterized iron-regulated membrane protein